MLARRDVVVVGSVRHAYLEDFSAPAQRAQVSVDRSPAYVRIAFPRRVVNLVRSRMREISCHKVKDQLFLACVSLLHGFMLDDFFGFVNSNKS